MFPEYKCFGCGEIFRCGEISAVCPVCKSKGVKIKEVSEVSEKEKWDKVIKKAEQFIDESRRA